MVSKSQEFQKSSEDSDPKLIDDYPDDKSYVQEARRTLAG